MAGEPGKPRFGRVLARAATSWVNLGVAGTAAVAAAALVSWPIAAIGGAAYAALVAWDVVNPDFWRKAFGPGAPDTVRLPSPRELEGTGFRGFVEALLAARAKLAEILSETPADVKAHVSSAIGLVAELEGRAATLIRRGVDLARFLKTAEDVEPLRQLIRQLRARVDGARDEETRKHLGDALLAREDHLRTLEDIIQARDRIAAQLARIVATVEGLPAKIVRMRALDAQAMDDLSGSVNDELERMNGEIRTFEETLRTLAEVPIG